MHVRASALIWLVSARGEAIVLIGFMGSGKSSVGRALEKRMGLPRYDTDEMVRARFALPIAEIFSVHGEAAFRDAETAALGKIPLERAIVVTGGGVVMRAENVERLRRLGTVVNLTADEETLFARVSRRATRPLLRTDNPRQTLSEMLRIREPLYRAAADVVIDTANLNHGEVADAIIANTGKAG